MAQISGLLFLGAFLVDRWQVNSAEQVNGVNVGFAWSSVEALDQPQAVRVLVGFASEQDGPESLQIDAWVTGPDDEPTGDVPLSATIRRDPAFAPRLGQPYMWRVGLRVPFTPREVGRHTVLLQLRNAASPLATIPFAVTLA